MASATISSDESAMPVDAPVDAPVDVPADQIAGNRLFARLPTELMVMIARPLTTPELCAFRASCKAVEQALFPSFRYEFFRKKQFMIEDGSLKALLAISRHERLASALSHIVIGLDHVNYLYRPDTQRDATHARQLAGAQHSLLCTGRAVELLTAAFRNLARYGNPRTIDLRDFDSKTRWRDGPHAAWRSYGAQTLPSMVSPAFRPRVYRDRFSFAAGVFAMVLRALAAARVCPTDLEVLFRDKLGGLADFAFDLTEFQDDAPSSERDGSSTSEQQRPSVYHVLRGLEKLHLDVRLARDRYHGHTNGFETDNYAEDYAPELYSMNLHAFVAAATNVRWLRLNLQRSDNDLVSAFLELFARPAAELDAVLWPQLPDAPLPPPPPPDRLRSSAPPFLERLDLGQAAVFPASLVDAVKRIPTLRALHLYVISLRATPLRFYGKSQWAWVLSEFAEATAPAVDGGTAATPLAHMREFSVASATQTSQEGLICPVRLDGKEYASYKGARLSDFLQKLSGNVDFLPSEAETLRAEFPGIEASGSEGGSTFGSTDEDGSSEDF